MYIRRRLFWIVVSTFELWITHDGTTLNSAKGYSSWGSLASATNSRNSLDTFREC